MICSLCLRPFGQTTYSEVFPDLYIHFSPTEKNKNEDPVNSLDRSAEEKERLMAVHDEESEEKEEKPREPDTDSECVSSTQRKMEEWERRLPSVSDGSMYLFWIGSECVHYFTPTRTLFIKFNRRTRN